MEYVFHHYAQDKFLYTKCTDTGHNGQILVLTYNIFLL